MGKEADRSDRQPSQKRPSREQTSRSEASCSQSKPAGQPAPELAPGLKRKPSCPTGSRSCAPISRAALEQQAGAPRGRSRSVTAGLGEGCLSASQPSRLQKLPPPPLHPAPCKAHLGAGLGPSERGLQENQELGVRSCSWAGMFFTHLPGSATGQHSKGKHNPRWLALL